MTELTEATSRLQQTWFWWNALDDGVKRVLDDIAARAPAAVAEVMGGVDADLLIPPAGTPFGEHLWSQVSAGSAPDPSRPSPAMIVIAAPFEAVSPWVPTGGPLRFQWTEENRGGADWSGGARQAKIVIQDEAGDIVTQAGVSDGTAQPGRPVRWDVDVVGVPDGRYWARLFVPYVDGMEFLPAGATQPPVEVRVGDQYANLERSVSSPADGFAQAAAGFAAAAEQVAGDDVDGAFLTLQLGVHAFTAAMVDAGQRGSPVDVILSTLGTANAGMVIAELRRASVAAGTLGDAVLQIIANGGRIDERPEPQVIVQAVRSALASSAEGGDGRRLPDYDPERSGVAGRWDGLPALLKQLRAGLRRDLLDDRRLDLTSVGDALRDVLVALELDPSVADTVTAAQQGLAATDGGYRRLPRLAEALSRLDTASLTLENTAITAFRSGEDVSTLPATEALVAAAYDLVDAVPS